MEDARSRQEDEDVRRLESYAHGFMVSQVVFAACELRVFDLLAQAPARRRPDARTMAARLGCSLDGTRMLLDACVALDLLTTDRAGRYGNSRLAATYLTSGGERSQRDMMVYLGRTPYRLWTHLVEGVREGRNQHARAFGISSSSNLFTAIYRDEEERLAFQRALGSSWRLEGRRVLSAFDLSAFGVVCDLGGGSGALARVCASIYPGCTVTVLEAPEVARVGAEQKEEEGAAGRVHFVEGDFFRDPLPEADLYILARVLHDWTDARCLELLSRLHQACKTGGAVLVVEAALQAPARGPLAPLLFSLNMLLQTEGRERRPAEIRALCARAGFRRVRARTVPGGFYGVVLATK